MSVFLVRRKGSLLVAIKLCLLIYIFFIIEMSRLKSNHNLHYQSYTVDTMEGRSGFSPNRLLPFKQNSP